MKIVVAMSGGVDSSVAAALLCDQGYDVVGLSMQLYDQSEGQTAFGSCCTLDDLYDARRVAHALGFPHYIMNFERQFTETVVANFIQEYAAGRTPLPCAHCNSDLKFATLLDRAHALGADVVATGHYARVERGADGRHLLKRGLDHSKDQSYFLFSLTQDQLARARFPVGHLPKRDVRDYARQRGLAVASKPDSQEICFIPDNDYARFVATHLPEQARDGVVVDQSGKVLARHQGIHAFTIGQRKGLGVGHAPEGKPLYVLALRPELQQVVVGPREALARGACTASGVNWILDPPRTPTRMEAQIRYRHRAAPAMVVGDGQQAQVTFDEPQSAVTPGQAIVFYQGDTVVGGGWID